MTENPATSTNDAAALLGAVEKAQSETNLYVRARLPELFLLVNAGALASVIGRDHRTANGATVATSLAGLAIIGMMYMRRRHNLGGTIGRAVWIVTGLLFLSGVASNLVVHGTAEEKGIGLCMAAAFLVLAAVERSYVLAAIGLVLLPLSFVNDGGLDKATSAVFGMVAVLVVGFVGARQLRLGRKTS